MKKKPEQTIYTGDYDRLSCEYKTVVKAIHDQQHRSMLRAAALEWQQEQQNKKKENERYGYEHNKTDD